ncbi:Hypothetical protein POVN_LOCUS620 [uncultured virus]|nr:Hypothetical protein POVN_LOCUS620 [uncultured virus]
MKSVKTCDIVRDVAIKHAALLMPSFAFAFEGMYPQQCDVETVGKSRIASCVATNDGLAADFMTYVLYGDNADELMDGRLNLKVEDESKLLEHLEKVGIVRIDVPSFDTHFIKWVDEWNKLHDGYAKDVLADTETKASAKDQVKTFQKWNRRKEELDAKYPVKTFPGHSVIIIRDDMKSKTPLYTLYRSYPYLETVKETKVNERDLLTIINSYVSLCDGEAFKGSDAKLWKIATDHELKATDGTSLVGYTKCIEIYPNWTATEKQLYGPAIMVAFSDVPPEGDCAANLGRLVAAAFEKSVKGEQDNLFKVLFPGLKPERYQELLASLPVEVNMRAMKAA